ncbi:MAG TPA: endo-1,3-alpha-glucanase family glycosylhydrolase, partial [Xanthobacteraceae bacterium]
VTWNDYSESTEVAPSSGTQFVFFDLATYFIAWFKLGRSPKIIRDAIYYLHRRQLVTPGVPYIPSDTPLHLAGPTPIQNKIELLAMLTKPATMQIEIAGHTFESSANAGMASLLAPARPGRPVFRILRNGRVELEKQSDWEIVAHPDRDDTLYVGGSTTRKFCANAQC